MFQRCLVQIFRTPCIGGAHFDMAAERCQIGTVVQIVVERLPLKTGLDNRQALADVAQGPPADLFWRMRIEDARGAADALSRVDVAALFGADDQLLSAAINALHP
ncbi:hypothetical protein D3C72_1636350 [compost metagenome]